MKSAPTRKKRPPMNRLADLLLKRLWFVAIVFISAGLVLIMGVKLEKLFPGPSSAADQALVEIVKVQPQSQISPVAAPSVLASELKPLPTQGLPGPTITNAPLPKATALPQMVAPSPVLQAKASVRAYFGHLPYAEDLPDRLVSIGKFVRAYYEREEALDTEAAQAFQIMVNAARSQGVQLMGISGFRNIADQQALFDKQIEKRGSAEAAAKLSAPPGHSEHHTGYALDITDASRTDVDLKVMFEETAAYQWLVANAANYGFEQSFPRNNIQGVSYEPWHWRFVQSPRSAQVFAAARAH
jgi:zinc D-Ala-D-Ala carboxypeptidase